MKTKFLLIICCFFSLSSQVRAQNNFPVFGLPYVVKPVVERSFWSLDWLRFNTSGWEMYSYDTLNKKQSIFDKNTCPKDAQGGFERFFYQYWDTQKNGFVDQLDINCNYEYSSSGLIEKLHYKESGYILTRETNTVFTYNQAGVESSTETLIEGIGSKLAKTIYQYDSFGRRIKDSTFDVTYKNAIAAIYYEYNQVGKCIKELKMEQIPFGDWDTTYIRTYEYYPNGLLKKYAEYVASTSANLDIDTEIEFFYTPKGYFETAKQRYWQSTTPGVTYFDRHYYDSLNRVIAFTSKKATMGITGNADSVYINYSSGGAYDTAYGYEGIGKYWKNKHTSFFVINKIEDPVGIIKAKPLKPLVKVFPNPASGYVTIALEDNNNYPELKIMDISGRIIKTFLTENISYGENELMIPLTDIAPGIYFLHYGGSTAKIIKE